MNLITITPCKDDKQKSCMKVELTVDGAEKMNAAIEAGTEIGISDLYDNEPDKDGRKLTFSPGQLSSTVLIPQENRLYTINVHKNEDTNSYYVFNLWTKDPKAAILFYPDKDNDTRMNEVTAKLAANQWAVYSDEKLRNVSIETNDRHQILCRVNEKTHEAIQTFKYQKYKQDDKYEDLLKSASRQIEKEIDYCREKMNIIKLICGNDYNRTETVAKLYKAYRGVVVTEEEKLKVKLVSNDKKETTAEAEGAPDPKGETGSSIGLITEYKG